MLDWLMEPIKRLIEWLYSGIYDFIVETFALFVEYATIIMLKFTLWATSFAWDVSSTILENIGASDALASAWNLLPSDTVSTLYFFNVPQGIYFLITTAVSKYVLRFIPFMGK